MNPHLHESFHDARPDPRLRWFCAPADWGVDTARGVLQVRTDAHTDFWQKTHYGFAVDNGHFLHTRMRGDFVLTVQARFQPIHQYDQAGIMVRVSPSCWLKSSVEYEPGEPGRLGAVVTNFGYSDWSTEPFPAGAGERWFRVRREADDYIVDTSPDGKAWVQLRMAHLHEGRGLEVDCGLYACSPKEAGFLAEFAHLTIDSGRLA